MKHRNVPPSQTSQYDPIDSISIVSTRALIGRGYGEYVECEELAIGLLFNSVVGSLVIGVNGSMSILDTVMFLREFPFGGYWYEVPDPRIASILAAGANQWKVVYCDVSTHMYHKQLKHYNIRQRSWVFVLSKRTIKQESSAYSGHVPSCASLQPLTLQTETSAASKKYPPPIILTGIRAGMVFDLGRAR